MKKILEFKDKKTRDELVALWFKRMYYNTKAVKVDKLFQKLMINNQIPGFMFIVDKYGIEKELFILDLLTEDEKIKISYEQRILIERLLEEGYLEKYK